MSFNKIFFPYKLGSSNADDTLVRTISAVWSPFSRQVNRGKEVKLYGHENQLGPKFLAQGYPVSRLFSFCGTKLPLLIYRIF